MSGGGGGFTAKHAQPFTLEEAMMLDVSTLAAEVSRLRNSVRHLQSTQADLRAYLLAEPDNDEDGEIKAALKENTEVMSVLIVSLIRGRYLIRSASQQERIGMLRLVLVDKVGEDSLAHYGFAEEKRKPMAATSPAGGTAVPPGSQDPGQDAQGADEGMHL